jgi:hypothetical protein
MGPDRFRALFCLALLSLSTSAPALAADEEEADEEEQESAAAPPKAAAAAEPSPAAPQLPPAEKAAPEPGLVVERLPSSAFPAWKPRGIKGGSMWLSMHGIPWPYYPKTGIGVSGSIWVDFGYESIKRGDPTQSNDRFLLNQSRAVLRATPTYSRGDWYVQGQTEFVANGDQSTPQPLNLGADDLWIRTGEWKSWDIQAGRFEAFEVYHFGMGMDLNTQERKGALGDPSAAPPDVFELGGNGRSFIAYRESTVSNLALHFYPNSNLRFEVLGQFGLDGRSGLDTVGARPAAVLDFGWLKLKAAGDVRKQFPPTASSKESVTLQGGTAALQLVYAPYIEGGVNFAYGSIKHYTPSNTADPNAALGDFDTKGSVTDLDTGGFVNARLVDGLVLGVGANYNQETDQAKGAFNNLQAFGALQIRLLDKLYVKLVGAYAKGHFAPGDQPAWENTMMSGRVRFLYLF